MSSPSSVADGTWSDEDIESLLITIGVVMVTSIVGWCFIIGPAVRRKIEIPPAAPADAANRTRRTMQNNVGTARNHHRPNNNYNTDNDNEDGILAMLRQKTRVPPHYYMPTPSSTPQTQHDGIVPFRQTKASTYDSSLASTDEDLLFQHRKDRARIFTRMFQLSPPPPRGSCMVLAIHASSSCQNPKTCRVIMLLASYYNLFLLLHMGDNNNNNNNDDDVEKEKESCVSQLRQVIPPNILPTHRIVPTGSSVGRIAFCRQLPKQPELVLDFDDTVKTQLTRFGFQVMIHNNIGQELIP